MRLAVALIILSIPFMADAMVISEIAWMGTVASHDDEWIELYNDEGSPVTLDGWTVQFGNSTIALTGSVDASGYVLLHRGGETTAPGTPLVTYTGALANTGSVVQLLRADQSVADSISAIDGWPAGDNKTKETMQRQGVSWVTAVATPAGPTAAVVPAEPVKIIGGGSNTTKTVRRDTPETEEKEKKEKEKMVVIKAPLETYVGLPMALEGIVTGMGQLEASLDYTWNFGDLSTTTGEKVEHVYEYAGKYAVTLQAEFKDIILQTRQDIEVKPITLTLSVDKNNTVRITNGAPYEVRLDGYTIRAGREKTFSKDSIILSGQSIVVDASTIGKNNFNTVFLLDRGGVIVASTAQPTITSATPRTFGASVSLSTVTPQKPPAFGFVSDEIPNPESPAPREASSFSEREESSIQENTPLVPPSAPSFGSWAYYLLSLLLLIVVGSLFIKNKTAV